MIEPALRRRRWAPYPWVWDYLRGQRRSHRIARRARGPVHVLFLFVDHYEPESESMVETWLSRYPALASAHRDADGRAPQYGWFWYFPGAAPRDEARYLRALGQLAFEGLGEVELHLHHEHDTAATLQRELERRLQVSNEAGAMLSGETSPRRGYGFIHGMWALDNSRLGAYCGVNNELQVLKATGCYADFTLASWGPMQSRWVNRIYMATDDPLRPKSYDSGTPVLAGRRPQGDLLIIQGPTVLHLDQLWRRRRPVYDHGDITAVEPPAPVRLDRWVRQWIHVEGRPEWMFVKVYTHGAVPRDAEALLGGGMDNLFSDLERRYNDGRRFVLHYVTAREAYNIIQAAADGRQGDPHAYRDYRIPPPVNRWLHGSSRLCVGACQPGSAFAVELLDPGEHRLRANAWWLRSVQGAVRIVEWRQRDDARGAAVTVAGTGWVALELTRPPSRVAAANGTEARSDGQTIRVRLAGPQPQELTITW